MVPYHIVNTSPLPVLVSLNLYGMGIALAISFARMQMHGVAQYLPYNLIAFAALPLILSLIMWQVDIIVEASLLGYHTPKVQFGINLAFILFILSEIALFGSIFWG